MSAFLLDVNVLVALLDPAHPHYEDAHRWFGPNRRRGWATCPITINGCVRVLSNPSYPTVEATVPEVIARLQTLCSSPYQEFWTDDVSLLDASLFRPALVGGHQRITDACLLALAVRKGGRLVSFDRGIPWKAVAGAGREHLVLLGAPPT